MMLSIHQSLVSQTDPVYDTWTGLRLPWAKTASNDEAGPYLRRILKQPGKKLMTEEGQELIQYLASLGEDFDPLVPWITSQYKKGELGFEGSLELPYTPLFPTGGPAARGRIALELEELQRIAQWYNATDHPTRQGLNIQEMDLTDVLRATEDHQKALEKEKELVRAAEEAKNSDAETVHTFDNGFTVKKLDPEDLWSEGKLLNHCIGGNSYVDDLENGYIDVYSLRDPEGLPKMCWHYDQYGDLDHYQGASGEPKEEYMQMFREWGEATGMSTEKDQGEMYYNLGEVGDWGTFDQLYSQGGDGPWGIAIDHGAELHEEAEIDWGPVNVPDIVEDLFDRPKEIGIVEPIVHSGYFKEFMKTIAEKVAQGDIDSDSRHLKVLELANHQLANPETGEIDFSDAAWNYDEETGKMLNPFEMHPEDPSYRRTPREKYEREHGGPKLFDYHPEFSTRLIDISGEEARGELSEWQEENAPLVALQVGKGEHIVPWWSEEEGRSGDLTWQTPIRNNLYGLDQKSDRTFAEEEWLGPASPYLPRYPRDLQGQFLR